MPRSYSFDHFTAQKPDVSKVDTTNDSHHPLKSETPLPSQEGLHYGQRFAQTVMRAQARRADRQTEQLLEEESLEMAEQPPEELSEVDGSQPTSAEAQVVQRPRRRVAKKRAAAKREHHTTVARRSTDKQQAASTSKAPPSRPARKATRGTKRIASTAALARTARGGKKPTAKTKAKTTRGSARRPTKKR